MTQQVLYDASSGIVLQWQDTSLYNYAAIPSNMDVLAVTAAQWSARTSEASWSVLNGVLQPTPSPSAADLLADAQSAQIGTLTSVCQAQIVAGYTSSALGAAHTYPSTPTDQLNMNVAVTASLLPGIPATWTTPFWCADSTGAWAMVEHTAAQIQQAGSDGKAAIQAARVKLATLVAQVQAATTVAEVQGVTW